MRSGEKAKTKDWKYRSEWWGGFRPSAQMKRELYWTNKNDDDDNNNAIAITNNGCTNIKFQLCLKASHSVHDNYIYNIPTKCTYTIKYTYYYHHHQHIATCFGAYCAILKEKFIVCSKHLLYCLITGHRLYYTWVYKLCSVTHQLRNRKVNEQIFRLKRSIFNKWNIRTFVCLMLLCCLTFLFLIFINYYALWQTEEDCLIVDPRVQKAGYLRHTGMTQCILKPIHT